MLVITRTEKKSRNQIVIGDNIVVTVLDVHGDKVHLGITAPRNVSIFRRELYDRLFPPSTEDQK